MKTKLECKCLTKIITAQQQFQENSLIRQLLRCVYVCLHRSVQVNSVISPDDIRPQRDEYYSSKGYSLICCPRLTHHSKNISQCFQLGGGLVAAKAAACD